ncbi:aldo/keto reductase [Frondihabitans australicus]|uniref:Aryl-alcohol dehydrogenase-like predicted oxidoreductase n=1 Tax=Frondihabitans australicus TaxID=386892 RepID=A0A495IAQ0_9MICO|nr:aldo/keto reductase [Frondihabitans australicus]RKR73079.1 aryl-alcohol dehydrogenase-like predicted oxidoreductase [Frondihabitans australicus]
MADAPRTTLGTSDVEIFPLNLGGNVFGWTADEKASFEVLDAYVEAGGNFVDTADVYSAFAPGNVGGESETIIGKWMKARGNRADMVIATKVGMLAGYEGTSRETVRKAVDESLRRLDTDYIDLYYAHRDFTDRPVEEAVEALNEQVELGKVRLTGASNFSGQRLEQALRFAESENLAKYAAIQNHYSLVERADVEAGTPTVASVALSEGVSVLPYFSLASGFLTGKYRDGVEVDSQRAGSASKYLDDRGRAVLAALDEVAAAHSTSVTAVSLAWLLAQESVAAPIASARTTQQLPDLIAAVGLVLTGDEVAALSAASGAPVAA